MHLLEGFLKKRKSPAIKTMTDIDGLVAYARRFVGIPYIFGGNNPIRGFDCSGLVCELMKRQGILKWNEDLSSQMLFDRVKIEGNYDVSRAGSLAFYGKGPEKIVHVGILVDSETMIEAGGGDRSTLSVTDAEERNAFVRERPVNYRRDLFAVIMPKYK